MDDSSSKVDDYEDYSEFYDYEYNASISSMPIEKVLPVGLFYGLIFVLGFIGNLLVIITISRYRRMKNITNTFLLSLASADLLLILLCIPIKFADFLTFTWVYGEFLCKIVHYLQGVSAVCSVITLTAMSLERYYAILHPMKAKYVCTVNKAQKATVAIWGISFVLAIPIAFVRVQTLEGIEVKGYWCTKKWGDKEIYHKLYEVYFLLVILVFPVTIMSFAYISICRELWAVSSQRSVMTQGRTGKDKTNNCLLNDSSDVHVSRETTPVGRSQARRLKRHNDDDSTRKQVIKMLIAIIVLFVICWAPIMMNNLLVAFKVLTLLNHGYLMPMRQAFYLLAYSNSSVNPIVYGFMSKNFRETFKSALSRCLKGAKQGNRSNAGKSNTRLTNLSSYPGLRSEAEIEEFELQINQRIDEDCAKGDDRFNT